MDDFLTLENFTPAQKYFTQVSLVANSTSVLTLTSKASTTKAKVFEVMSVRLPWEWNGLVRLTRCLSLPPRRLHDSWLTRRRCDWKKPFGGIGPFIYIAHCPQGPASAISGSQNLISVLKQSLVWHKARRQARPRLNQQNLYLLLITFAKCQPDTRSSILQDESCLFVFVSVFAFVFVFAFEFVWNFVLLFVAHNVC